MRPAADQLYRSIIPRIKSINREDYRLRLPAPLRINLGPLDKDMGIDVVFELDNGMKLTLQEKFGSPNFASLKDVTIEYENKPSEGIPGDWFTMICQLYFFGFATEDFKWFAPWVLLDYAQVVRATLVGELTWELKLNTKNGAQASFMRTWMSDIPQQCILAASWI